MAPLFIYPEPGGYLHWYLSILRLKCVDALFDHLLQFFIFGAAFKVGI